VSPFLIRAFPGHSFRRPGNTAFADRLYSAFAPYPRREMRYLMVRARIIRSSRRERHSI
jgi:hypothetical protein